MGSMNTSREQWVKFIASLLEKTQNNELIWRTAGRTDVPEIAGNEVIDAVFVAAVADRLIRIYQRKYERSESNSYLELTSGRGSTWRTETVIEIADPSQQVWARVPTGSGASDLYAAVQKQVVQIDDFLLTYFGEKGAE